MRKHLKKDGDLFLNSLELCMISPSSVVVMRELFEKYGLFDERLPVCEDYDMWLRITRFEKAGLIRKKLIKKYGGHESQLSRKYWGMDKYRIYSIINLLKNDLKKYNLQYYNKAKETAIKKCEIMLNGAVKRRKAEFSEYLSSIIESLKTDNYMHIDSEILLQE